MRVNIIILANLLTIMINNVSAADVLGQVYIPGVTVRLSVADVLGQVYIPGVTVRLSVADVLWQVGGAGVWILAAPLGRRQGRQCVPVGLRHRVHVLQAQRGEICNMTPDM